VRKLRLRSVAILATADLALGVKLALIFFTGHFRFTWLLRVTYRPRQPDRHGRGISGRTGRSRLAEGLKRHLARRIYKRLESANAALAASLTGHRSISEPRHGGIEGQALLKPGQVPDRAVI